MHELVAILLNVLLPILVLIALGAWVRRQFAVDLGTLGKINIYLFVPAFVYQKVATSTLPWSEMGGVVLITIAQVFVLGMLVWGIGRMITDVDTPGAIPVVAAAAVLIAAAVVASLMPAVRASRVDVSETLRDA